MRRSIAFGSGLAALGLVAGAIVVLDLSAERAILLAPVLIVSAAAVVGLVLFWTRVALDPLLRRENPSDAARTVAGRDGMDDQALSAGAEPGARR